MAPDWPGQHQGGFMTRWCAGERGHFLLEPRAGREKPPRSPGGQAGSLLQLRSL